MTSALPIQGFSTWMLPPNHYCKYSIYHNLVRVQLYGIIVTILVQCAAISKAIPVHSAHIGFIAIGNSPDGFFQIPLNASNEYIC